MSPREARGKMKGRKSLSQIFPHDKKKGQKHNEAGLDAKELRKRYDRQGKIDVFLAKSGTKVHFVRECPGLNAADFTRIQTRTLCGNCLKHQRLLKDDPEDAFSL